MDLTVIGAPMRNAGRPPLASTLTLKLVYDRGGTYERNGNANIF